jgi:hypothetical protein
MPFRDRFLPHGQGRTRFAATFQQIRGRARMGQVGGRVLKPKIQGAQSTQLEVPELWKRSQCLLAGDRNIRGVNPTAGVDVLSEI